jgi:hypothetical protein
VWQLGRLDLLLCGARRNARVLVIEVHEADDDDVEAAEDIVADAQVRDMREGDAVEKVLEAGAASCKRSGSA